MSTGGEGAGALLDIAAGFAVLASDDGALLRGGAGAVDFGDTTGSWEGAKLVTVAVDFGGVGSGGPNGNAFGSDEDGAFGGTSAAEADASDGLGGFGAAIVDRVVGVLVFGEAEEAAAEDEVMASGEARGDEDSDGVDDDGEAGKEGESGGAGDNGGRGQPGDNVGAEALGIAGDRAGAGDTGGRGEFGESVGADSLGAGTYTVTGDGTMMVGCALVDLGSGMMIVGKNNGDADLVVALDLPGVPGFGSNG